MPSNLLTQLTKTLFGIAQTGGENKMNREEILQQEIDLDGHVAVVLRLVNLPRQLDICLQDLYSTKSMHNPNELRKELQLRIAQTKIALKQHSMMLAEKEIAIMVEQLLMEKEVALKERQVDETLSN